MKSDSHSPKYPVQSLEKAFRILDYIHDSASSNGVTLGAIARDLNMTKSSVHRILDTMLEHGFVEKKGTSIAAYNLSWGIFKIGNVVPSRHSLNSSNYVTIMETLSQDVQHTTTLSVKEEHSSAVVYKVTPGLTHKTSGILSQHDPLYASSAGKLFMLNYNKDEIMRYFQNTNIRKYTSHTILNYLDFLDELEQIRRDGYSIDRGEFEEDTWCIAMPIRNYTGEITAGLSVSAPPEEMQPEDLEKIKTYLKPAVDELSAFLGWSESDR
ncbi:MAG: IclR family transcriptional regulator [Eubacteriales bacterium]|nr:IclR family transcriptional regulator [Eubacteriales bacterium]